MGEMTTGLQGPEVREALRKTSGGGGGVGVGRQLLLLWASVWAQPGVSLELTGRIL